MSKSTISLGPAPLMGHNHLGCGTSEAVASSGFGETEGFRTSCDGWDGCTWGVYSGNHPLLKIKQGEPIERTLADILFTRGEGAINESRFAGAISRGGPAPDSYLIENYRHLALTEHAGVKAAACEALWILLPDPSLREIANAGMQQASCHCRMVEHDSDFGRHLELVCGAKGYQHDDPPY